MKFEFRGGLLYVPLSLTYHKVTVVVDAILDTGSAGTAVDVNLVQLDLVRESTIADIVGIGGAQPVIIQKVEKVTIGDVSADNFPIEFADLRDSFGVSAFIGSDLLMHLLGIIDYSSGELRFSRS